MTRPLPCEKKSPHQKVTLKILFQDRLTFSGIHHIFAPQSWKKTFSRPHVKFCRTLQKVRYREDALLILTPGAQIKLIALTDPLRREYFDHLISCKPALMIFAQCRTLPPSLKKLFKDHHVPIAVSLFHENLLESRIKAIIQEKIKKCVTLHGVALQIQGKGILITGASGIGKTSTAIQAVQDGYCWIADDVAVLHKQNDQLFICGHRKIKNYLHTRQTGIVSVDALLQASAIKSKTKLTAMIDVFRTDTDVVTFQVMDKEILGARLPCLQIGIPRAGYLDKNLLKKASEILEGVGSLKNLQVVIITGLSGSGKSTALRALEDIGYFCVDNLPVVLLPKFLSITIQSSPHIKRVAMVMDLRERSFVEKYQRIFERLKEKGYKIEILFLEATEDSLLRRFSETRRNHPLSAKGSTIMDGIQMEVDQLSSLRQMADKIIDTTTTNVHQLKDTIQRQFLPSSHQKKMVISVMSFGYRYGLPSDADLVVDIRFLPNPYYVEGLKKYDGHHPAVANYVLENKESKKFLKKAIDMMNFVIPLYEKEGKARLTVAFGCTGGKHRSVVMANQFSSHFQTMKHIVHTTHRDINKS